MPKSREGRNRLIANPLKLLPMPGRNSERFVIDFFSLDSLLLEGF